LSGKHIYLSVMLLLGAFPALGWKNGAMGPSPAGSPKFGTHDWIAHEALKMAEKDVDLAWLRKRTFPYFFGTEAPDVGPPDDLNVENGYHDTGACHCVLFKKVGETSKERATQRAQQEFDKAEAAFTAGKLKQAAFYLGAMAHYLGDLSQFCHVMGEGSRWGAEDQTLHARYEKVVDVRADAKLRRIEFLQSFIKKKAVAGDTAEELALAVAEFTDTGGGTDETAGSMYNRWEEYTPKKRGDPSEWDDVFLDQTGKNINVAVNAIAKLLRKLGQ